jgi:hypothetical protein
MNVLLYSQTLDPNAVIASVGNQDVTSVSSYLRLAERVVEEKNLFCVLIQIDGLDEECRRFLSALKKSFPILNVGVITQANGGRLPEGYSRIDIRLEKDAFGKEIKEFITSLAMLNRREYHRFSWPIKGFLSFDGKTWEEYPLHSVSAGGAFLESTAAHPEPGTKAALRVVFENFKLATRCEILDARQASSNLPMGFAVRFTGLSETSQHVMDKIIHEAIVHNLTESESGPMIPTLGEDDVMTADFERL